MYQFTSLSETMKIYNNSVKYETMAIFIDTTSTNAPITGR